MGGKLRLNEAGELQVSIHTLRKEEALTELGYDNKNSECVQLTLRHTTNERR